jgi:hypothetical protein
MRQPGMVGGLPVQRRYHGRTIKLVSIIDEHPGVLYARALTFGSLLSRVGQSAGNAEDLLCRHLTVRTAFKCT